jgi:alpha-ketoglutarate-dependent taurine dioxygenase/acyl carrier protein
LESYVAPRTPVEEVLAGIWAQIFRTERVGIDDNFFELGGHSLLATQVVARIRDTFQIELHVHSLFKTPTVAGLAETIEATLKAGAGLISPPLVRVARERELPLSFAQQRMWFIDQFERGNSLYNVPVAIRLTGALNVAALEESLNEILRRHEVLRTTYAEVNGRPVQLISATQTLPLPLTDLRALTRLEREAETRRVAGVEAKRPFDLSAGPVLRAMLLRLADEEHVLLLTTHHIVSDAWTKGVLMQEVAEIYRAFSEGRESPLAELPVQYADYAVWQREWLQGEVLEAQIGYWKEQLAGAPPLLELPLDKPRPAVQTFRGATYNMTFTAALRDALKDLSRHETATLFMTLLAAFQTLLSRSTGTEDIVVGTNVANRNRVETEKLIGFFVNHLLMRTDLGGSPTFRQLLARVREVALNAYAHQDLPFDQLVKALNPKRNSAYHPLFQVLLVLQNAPLAAVELPRLTLSPLEQADEIAQFDLALFIEETDAGMTGLWRYSTDLFDAATVARLAENFVALLESIVARPEARIGELNVQTELKRAAEAEKQTEVEKQAEVEKQTVETPDAGAQPSTQTREARRSLKSVRRKSVDFSQASLVETGYLPDGEKFPLVLRPSVKDIDLQEWAGEHREFLEAELLKHGAILFRGFHVSTSAEFERVAQAIGPDLFSEYGDLPREEVSGKIYGSTPYPAEQSILFHNESSHMHRWPRKIWFYCVKAAEQGGETPIVDCRKVYRLLDPQVRERLERKGLMYVRNYTDGLDVSWQSFFHTNERASVEDYCRKAQIEFVWKKNQGLQTRQLSQAVAVHPRSGETVFFNQIQLHHVACLDRAVRESLLTVFAPEDLPRNVCYGDGSPIENEVVEHVSQVYRQAAVSFPWQEGDILMLDNMLAAHARNPFTGARKIVVAMGELIHQQDII